MIVELQKLPKEFQRERKEPNLLTYTDFEILIYTDKTGEFLGSVRTGICVENPPEGLITDLWVDDTGMQGVPLRGYYARLLKEAESVLRKKGVKKVDAYYLDGPGKLSHYYSCGYIPQRRTVEIEWDLSEGQIVSGIENTEYSIKTPGKLDEIQELFKNSFQPYWVAPHDFRGKKFFIANKENRAIGMVDEDLEVGVVIRKGFGGDGLGSVLLNTALTSLKKKGKKKVSTLATSGLDDYDPQIYLYTMNGGKIVREYVNLQKTL